MDFPTPSPAAQVPPASRIERKYIFPFDLVPLGRTFHVGKDEVKSIEILRTLASRNGKRLGRKFRVIDHTNFFEVFYFENRVGGAQVAQTKDKQPTVGNDPRYDETGDLVGRWKG